MRDGRPMATRTARASPFDATETGGVVSTGGAVTAESGTEPSVERRARLEDDRARLGDAGADG